MTGNDKRAKPPAAEETPRPDDASADTPPATESPEGTEGTESPASREDLERLRRDLHRKYH